jgi:N-acetylmuramoyl-L-alanine amidase
VRAPGEPPRIGLQAGHWLAAEVPEELDGIRYNGGEGGGRAEWEVTLEIARLTASLLEAQGYVVDVLPTTIPPLYYADAFVSIHADGHEDPEVSGFTVAGPRRDETGRSAEFARLVGETYGEATKLRQRTYITRRMTGYYAFNARRYEHALHPETAAVILETGVLSSPNDRRVILDGQDLSARGIADAIVRFVPHTTGPTVAAAAP